MSKLFLTIINMSISASWIVLAVLLLRFLLKKAPKWLTVLLWAVVAIRLICPFAIESDVSLIPSSQTISTGIMTDTYPQIYTGIPAFNNSINPIVGEVFSPNPGDSANPLQIWIPVASVLWCIGIFAMTLYGIISYLRIKKKVATAVLFRDNIYQSENVYSPFVLGIIRPKVYLPFTMTGSEMIHVIAHEEAHILRKDHWWKPLGFAILAVHWFNPLVWIAYVLLCRDIEIACDQKVIRKLTESERADYSQALLNCSVGRRMISSCPLAFGEVGVKDRIKSVLSYKKPAFWVMLLGIIASIVLAICFLTNPTPGTLGTLENLEFISLSERKENTACVWVSDGFSYSRVGAISKDLLRDLASLKTSKAEVSLSRSEDRDKSHTIVLQSEKQAEASLNSYLEGLYIHFNSDFTSVWINNNVKPTLSYKVIEPEKAREVYNYIADYNVKAPAVQIPTISSDATYTDYFISSLTIDEATFDIDNDGKEEYCVLHYGPTSGLFSFSFSAIEDGVLEYFNIFTCPWTDLSFSTTAEGKTVLVGRGGDYEGEQLLSLDLDDNGNIVIFSNSQDVFYWGEQGILSPYASRIWGDPEQTFFDSGPLKTIEGNFRTYYQNTDGTYQYNGYFYKYRLVITGRMPNAKVDTTYVYLSNIKDISFERAMWASGLSSSLEQYFSPVEAVLVEIYTGDTEESTTPTGYPSEEIGQPQIRYGGKVYYYFATGFDEPLPKGYRLVGTVTDVDNTQAPDMDFYGARVVVGQEIYASESSPDTIYLKYESGYAQFSIR